MDVIEGPLEKARGNLELYNMTDRVELRLSDGLDAYREGEAQGLVIAGMGGRIMSRILLREPAKTRDFQELILQPQADPDFVRRALRELGLYIDREKVVLEDNKYYPVMHVRHAYVEGPDWTKIRESGEKTDDELLRDAEDLFGPVLLRERDDMLKSYLLWQKGVNDRILHSLKRANDSNNEALT
jgi:tRNA (adenine22-N1)-methyltransferase